MAYTEKMHASKPAYWMRDTLHYLGVAQYSGSLSELSIHQQSFRVSVSLNFGVVSISAM